MIAPLHINDDIVGHEFFRVLRRIHTNAFWDKIDKIMLKWREATGRCEKKWASLQL